ELVGGRVRHEPIPRFARLDEALRRPGVVERIKFDQRVTVPIVGRHIRAPYTFQNGALNLIKPERFAGSQHAVTGVAMKLAVEGDLLRRHGIEEENGSPAKLVVITDFAETERDLRPRISRLFNEYQVRAVDVAHVDELLEEIRRTAH